jgi:phosphatidylglycerophosphatase A
LSAEAGVAPRASDRLAFALATAGGAGYLPIAPGTWGSGVVVAVVYAIYLSGLSAFAGPAACAALVGAALVLAWLGVWAGDRVAALLNDDDPSVVVIDEVVGQLLTYSLLPVAGHAWGGWSFELALAAGFLLFRALDVVKPGPIDDLQRFHGGLGIMADDFLAGVVGGWAMLVATLLL